MKYSAAAVVAFAGAAIAQTAGFDPIFAPATGDDVQAGETFTITWEAAPSEFDEETVDIILLAGDSPSTLDFVDPPIAEGIVNSDGSFEWDVPADLGEAKTYGVKIQLSSDTSTFQYSEPFEITPSEGGEDEDEDEDEEDGETPVGNSTTTAKPTKTSSDEEEETGDVDDSSSSVTPPKTTLTTTVDTEPTGTTDEPDTIETPGAASHASAGAFALVGGLALALAL